MGGGSGSGSGAMVAPVAPYVPQSFVGAGSSAPPRFSHHVPLHREEKKKESGQAPHPPMGFHNWGNTCYANAALQCLLATALGHALLDSQAMPTFRRYASNPNLLSLGSGSVDSDEMDEDDIIVEGKRNRKEERKEMRRSRSEIVRREQEHREMQRTCQWLKDELSRITMEYTAGPAFRPPPAHSTRNSHQKGGIFGMFSGFHVNKNRSNHKNVVDPGSITKNPHKLSKCLRPYRQEDAHEFLRALLSTLIMNGQNKQLSSLFDGLLESAVTCQTCGHSSLTRDRYMDLSLDISHPSITDLYGALREFTVTETLDGPNKVTCDKCQVKRAVTKGLRLATAPTTLVCHLKRFAYDPFGRLVRLNKHIKLPSKLEIGEFMSRANRSTPPPYELVGVLVHQGRTCDSGHYLAYVKSGDEWYKANDAVVTKVSLATVLEQKAYIAMYEVADMRRKHGFDTYHRYHESPSSPMADTIPKAASDTYDKYPATGGGNLTSQRRRSTGECDTPLPSKKSKASNEDDHDSFTSALISILNVCGVPWPTDDFVVFGDFCGSPAQVQDNYESSVNASKQAPVKVNSDKEDRKKNSGTIGILTRDEGNVNNLKVDSSWDPDNDDDGSGDHNLLIADPASPQRSNKATRSPKARNDISTQRTQNIISNNPAISQDVAGASGKLRHYVTTIGTPHTSAQGTTQQEYDDISPPPPPPSTSPDNVAPSFKRSPSSGNLKEREKEAARAYNENRTGGGSSLGHGRGRSLNDAYTGNNDGSAGSNSTQVDSSPDASRRRARSLSLSAAKRRRSRSGGGCVEATRYAVAVSSHILPKTRSISRGASRHRNGDDAAGEEDNANTELGRERQNRRRSDMQLPPLPSRKGLVHGL